MVPGHFVKMVHNGIEYADMQVIGEAYDILRRGLGMDAEEIGDVFAEWNKGDLDSYLIEITAEILHHKDAETGKPFVDVVVDHAGMKGTGTWTVQTGLECGSPVAAIGEAVFARALSSHGELREDAQKEGLAGPNKTIDLAGEDKAAFVEDVRKALFASKVVAYAQGLNRDSGRCQGIRLGYQPVRSGPHLAWRLHYSRPVPARPHHRGLQGR